MSGSTIRVGLNLLSVRPGGGGATRYAENLVPALRAVAPDLELTGFIGGDAPVELTADPRCRDVDWVRLPVRVSQRTHLLGQLAALPALARRRHLDVLHSLANIGPLLTPGVARVVTLLDVIWLHQGSDWEAGAAARGFAALSRICARNADRVLTISESAKEDIASSLGLDRSKIDVAPLGVRSQQARAELPHEPVVLCVAQKRPYKNLGSLIRAIAELGEPARLVLAGAPTPHEEELKALAAELGVAGRVSFRGWVSDDELEALYRESRCFVLPSLIEGFGLPVLEAMTCGVPVACSNRPALPEVAGNAALLFDPEDQSAVTEAVGRLLRDDELARTLAERGVRRAAELTWEATAQATVASYRKAARSPV